MTGALMPVKPCLTCGTLTPESRCPDHKIRRRRAAHPRPGYTNQERLRRKAVVDAYREEYGEICPGWNRPAHPTGPGNPLTADHVFAVGAGGPESGPLTVLCQSCNGRKSAYAGHAGGGTRPAGGS